MLEASSIKFKSVRTFIPNFLFLLEMLNGVENVWTLRSTKRRTHWPTRRLSEGLGLGVEHRPPAPVPRRVCSRAKNALVPTRCCKIQYGVHCNQISWLFAKRLARCSTSLTLILPQASAQCPFNLVEAKVETVEMGLALWTTKENAFQTNLCSYSFFDNFRAFLPQRLKDSASPSEVRCSIQRTF